VDQCQPLGGGGANSPRGGGGGGALSPSFAEPPGRRSAAVAIHAALGGGGGGRMIYQNVIKEGAMSPKAAHADPQKVYEVERCRSTTGCPGLHTQG
jgi:hypothetical protein